MMNEIIGCSIVVVGFAFGLFFSIRWCFDPGSKILPIVVLCFWCLMFFALGGSYVIMKGKGKRRRETERNAASLRAAENAGAKGTGNSFATFSTSEKSDSSASPGVAP